MSRQIVLDTETTGLETADGHRIIEIGAVELIERRVTRNRFHQYINPDRRVDAEALDVHGISNEFLREKPRFREISEEFVAFLDGAEIIAHNAEFDVGFIDYEFSLLDRSPGRLSDLCQITDSLELAKKMHPGARNSLDALCRRYEVDHLSRDLHGALLDARLLAEVYLRMTGGQTSLLLEVSGDQSATVDLEWDRRTQSIPVVKPRPEETAAHNARLDQIDQRCEGGSLWRQAMPG